MKGFNFANTLGIGRNPWTCRRCLAHVQPKAFGGRQIKGFASRAGRIQGGKRKPRVLIAAATTGGIAATALAFTEPIQHSWEASERTGRVASALFVCINEYVTFSTGLGEEEADVS